MAPSHHDKPTEIFMVELIDRKFKASTRPVVKKRPFTEPRNISDSERNLLAGDYILARSSRENRLLNNDLQTSAKQASMTAATAKQRGTAFSVGRCEQRLRVTIAAIAETAVRSHGTLVGRAPEYDQRLRPSRRGPRLFDDYWQPRAGVKDRTISQNRISRTSR